ncbi:DUF4255 domain-containing protein [Burkholderia sp. SIMBA_062]|uniref:DUF4255 domain-containing protein n=1 Tax=Burkholderia sp. SIMBA_062 TaxID=3085803 RepID=UPI00397C8720
MATTLGVDEKLLELNDEIKNAIELYLPGSSIQIRFDIPDKSDPPNDPTLCVFLYDIQEDLELRHGQSRMYDVTSQRFAPGQVSVRCCYLITYWESRNIPDTHMGPRSQSMLVMNLVLNALLNLKLPNIAPTFKRVIAPSEHLSSLGNFWQALGNKPRLCLNFAVTVPIALRGAAEEHVVPVMFPKDELVLLGKTGDTQSPAEHVAKELLATLVSALQQAGQQLNLPLEPAMFKAQLDSLKIACSLATNGKLPTERSRTGGSWDVRVSGILAPELKSYATTTINNWKQMTPHSDFKIEQIDTTGLAELLVPPVS